MGDAPQPFAQVLHRDRVRDLAGTPVFDRGARYAREGRVEGLVRRGGRLTASVCGSARYEVAIWVRGDGLAYSCTCPFAEDGAFCKHCVAAALAWLASQGLEDGFGGSTGGPVAKGSTASSGNLFAEVAAELDEELMVDLVTRRGVRVERIVSTGQVSPPGFWYDQPWHEWVVLLRGAAAIRFEDELAPRALVPGDWIWIAAHRRHRVERTAPDEATVWLAVHLEPGPGEAGR